MCKTFKHYGMDVPIILFTPKVKSYISMVESNIGEIEQMIDDSVGTKKTSLKRYLEKVKNNIKMAPYRLNNDVYLKKYNNEQETKINKNKTKKIKKRKK